LPSTEYAHHVIEKITVPWAIKTFLAAGLGERLAGESGAEDVVGWNVPYGDFSDIAVCVDPEILGIELAKAGVDLTGEDATVSKSPKRYMEPAQPREQIHKFHGTLDPPLHP
jgi:ribulose 1,5-bisphosphate synthetase/thiazole synthase